MCFETFQMRSTVLKHVALWAVLRVLSSVYKAEEIVPFASVEVGLYSKHCLQRAVKM